MVDDRSLRFVRGLTVAAAGVMLPVAGHAIGGGGVRITPATLLVATFVAAVTTAVSRHEWTLLRIAATLLPVQALVHVSLASGTGHGASHGTPSAPDSSVDGAMLVGHLVALVAVALWLRLAERAMLALATLIDRLFVRPTTWSAPTAAWHRTERLVSHTPLFWLRGVQPRAPPQLTFV
jgi:hypothetical protein